MPRVASAAVIGAGIAGLACARELRAAGVQVTVYEKSRGVGGRCATRRLDATTRFDHGAQYFTVRDPRFATMVEQWRLAGAADLWRGRIVSLSHGAVAELSDPLDRFVGVPGMSAIARWLAAGLDVRTNSAIREIRRIDHQWHIEGVDGAVFGPFAALVVTAPPPQTFALLASHSPAISQTIESIRMAPCWAAILQLSEALTVPYDAAFVQGSPLAWIALNDSKPQRPLGQCWTLHATADWSRAHLEQSADEVARELVHEFWQATGQRAQQPAFLAGHRWRYALPIDPLPQPFVLDVPLALAVCGDWCGGPRVEGAFLSGVAAAAALRSAE